MRDYVAKYVADLTGYKLTPAIRETEQLEKATDSTADAVVRDWQRMERGTDRAARAMKQDADKVAREQKQILGDAGRDAGDEFAQNLGESLSSGDVSGLLSGTVGGLVGTFGKGGPIALALGALGAVGVGVFQAMQAQAEQAASAAQQAFDDLRESASKEAKLNAFLTDRFGGTLQGWEQISRYAEASGQSAEDIATALAEGGSRARALAERWEDIARAEYESTNNVGRANSLLLDGVDDLRDRADAMERAAAAAETERDALGRSLTYLQNSDRYYRTSYGRGSSTYSSQVPRYTGGKRS